jgi:hypothetical protein
MRGNADLLPVLLDLDLIEGGWDGTVSPYPGIKVHTFAIQALRNSLFKKFEDKKDEGADAAALEKFLDSNNRCSTWPGLPPNLPDVEAIALGEAKDFIQRLFFSDEGLNYFTWSRICDGFSFGNGSNIGAPGTDFFSKTALSSMSTSNQLLRDLFSEAISSDPLWSSVESTRHKFRGSDIVRGSRLSYVPKTRTISRTICTEPVLNMMFQKGAQKVLEKLLLRGTGIDLSIQPDKNRELARRGSIDGSFGTIDLSSASDSLSLSMVDQMFPKEVTRILRSMRSPLTILPDGREVELHMISSMGNAYTFPLQTILFSAVVYGVYRSIGITPDYPRHENLGNFAVFGDDIIVRREAYDLTVKILSYLGFVVNVDKSFNNGDFRESCGFDFMSGHNVRGVYIRSLKTDGDVYSAINRLNRWSAQWNITLRRVVKFLLKGVRLLRIPFDEMDDAGVKVPLSCLPRVSFDRDTGGVNYRCMVQSIHKVDLTDVESRPPTSMKGWFPNYNGVLLAALASTLRDASVSPRVQRKRWRIKVRSSSRWDWIDPPRYLCTEFGERWKSQVALNLSF